MLGTNVLILVGVLGGALGVAVLVKAVIAKAAASGARSLVREDDMRSKLVYFWTPSCVVCRSTQSRIVDEVARDFGDSTEIIKINAHDEPEQARAFGVMTVPTIVVLGPDDTVHTVNTGVVDRDTLAKQLRASQKMAEPYKKTGGTVAPPVL